MPRLIPLWSVAVALSVACPISLSAENARDVARYSFTVANAPKDTVSPNGRMRVRIIRWSTDAERQQLIAALEEPSKLLNAFQAGDVGYLQWPGGLEYSVRYARRTARPDGGADIVLVVQRPLWLWWDASNPWAADQHFTVVNMRLKKDGTGEGRIATGTGFQRDTDNGIVVSDATKPPLLVDVRVEAVG